MSSIPQSLHMSSTQEFSSGRFLSLRRIYPFDLISTHKPQLIMLTALGSLEPLVHCPSHWKLGLGYCRFKEFQLGVGSPRLPS